MAAALSTVDVTVSLKLHIPAETAAMVSEIVIGETVFRKVDNTSLDPLSRGELETDTAPRGELETDTAPRGELETDTPDNPPPPPLPAATPTVVAAGKPMIESKCHTCLQCFKYPWRTGPKRKYCDTCVKAKKNTPAASRKEPASPINGKALKRTFGARGQTPDTDGASAKARTRLLEEAAAGTREL